VIVPEPVVVPEAPLIVTVYVPAVVPGLPVPPPPLLLLLPPQPMTPSDRHMTTAAVSSAGRLRLRFGTAKNSSSASAVPPPEGHSRRIMRLSAVDAAVVVTVSVEVCAPVPVIVTEVGDRTHCAGSLAATGLIEQLSATVPVKPLVGVTEIVDVLPVVAPGTTLIADPLNVNPGAAVTVSATVVDAVKAPEVPLMVTVTGPPTVAPLLADSVSTCVPATVPAAKIAVTPLGRPEAASATLPVNPPTLATVIVLVEVLPCTTDSVAGAAVSVKLAGTFTVSAMVVEAVSAPDVPVIVTVAGPPTAALLLAVSVTMLELVAGLVEKLAVTPLGRPVAASVTLPVKLFAPETVMVSVLLLP